MTQYHILFSKKYKIFKSKLKSRKTINILFMGVTFKEDCNDIRNSNLSAFINYSKNKKRIH